MHHVDINAVVLARGKHDCGDPQGCLFEFYNEILSYRKTDSRPADVSAILHTFGMRLNDLLPDQRRQTLKEFLPQPERPSPLAGTFDDGLDEARGYLALDWLIRTYTPAWLDLAGLSAEAQQLRDLRRIVDLVAAQAAGPVVRNASSRAAAAWAAAGDAAGDAAWAAAWAAAGDAAWAAAGAAGDAARAAAGDAAGAAARAAARAAAGDAAGDALQPTVDTLQESAIQLYRDMIHPGQAS
jgi:hypothetical protein